MALTNLMVERLKPEKTTQFLIVSNIVEKCITNLKNIQVQESNPKYKQMDNPEVGFVEPPFKKFSKIDHNFNRCGMS